MKERFLNGVFSSQISHLARTCLVRTVIALSTLVLIISCTSACGSAEGPSEATQQWFQTTTAANQTYLIDGYIIYSPHVSTDVDTSINFSVTVCSKSASNCHLRAQYDTPAAPPASAATHVGARIKAHLTTDAPGRVTLASTEVQPVIGSADDATWTWQLTPSASGSFTITATFTALRADTPEPLTADTKIDAKFAVAATIGHSIASAWSFLTSSVTVLVAGIGALGLSAGSVWTYFHKRAKRVSSTIEGRRRTRAGIRRPRQKP